MVRRDFFPLVCQDIVEENLAVDGSVGLNTPPTYVALATVNDEIVLVGHHDVVETSILLFELFFSLN